MIDCRRCKKDLHESEFKPDARYKRGYTSWCHECHRERNREHYVENKKRRNEKAREWAKCNKEKQREIWRAFHERNKEKRAAAHAEWARRNREKRSAATAKRKAAELQATPKWVNWEKVKAIYREARRLQDFTGIKMHVDHIFPLQGETVCGLHWEANLQIIPASANIAKNNKMPDEATRQPRLFSEPAPKPIQEGMDI